MVIPSILPEGCPTSILEGMSYCKPVIGYDIQGLNELITHNKTGLIVPLLDSKKMAESILSLINNPDLIEKFGINGYNKAKKNFCINDMLKKHREYFNSI